MITAYLQERYGNVYKDCGKVAEILLDKSLADGRTLLVKPYGFIIYKLDGDALVLYDMYVNQGYRGKKMAWALFAECQKIAKDAQKAVIITFSEHCGQNHELGLGAIKAAGFKLAYTTKIDQVFIQGV